MSITVRATSADSSTITQSYTITVNDLDEFDVTPIVDNNPTVDNINENVTVGTAVGITAFSDDLDATTNVVTYSLNDSAGGLFAIDGATGVVTTAAAIDYETVGSALNITVRATSTDGSTTTQAFTVTVNDLDEFDVTPIVDNDALVAALESGRIAGAGLDVYDIEPLPADSRLRHVPNLILTPHIGYATRNSFETFYPDTLDAVLAFLNGKPIRVVEP